MQQQLAELRQQRIPCAINDGIRGSPAAPHVPTSPVVSNSPEVVPNSLPQTLATAVQPAANVPATSPAVDTNTLLQQVIPLLTAQQSAPSSIPNAPMITPVTVASNTQLPAPSNNRHGADGGFDQFQQLEERHGAMEKRLLAAGLGH